MSLIEAMMEKCIIMNASKESDGQGGFQTVWSEGAEILCAIVLDTSMSARVAEKEGVTNLYTITTTRANALDYHTVIKRKKDGATFRITGDANEKTSPIVSTLNMAQASAERWELT